MAVVAPMPRARVMIATEVNPGLLRNMRRPKRRSCARSCSQFILRISRHLLFVRLRPFQAAPSAAPLAPPFPWRRIPQFSVRCDPRVPPPVPGQPFFGEITTSTEEETCTANVQVARHDPPSLMSQCNHGINAHRSEEHTSELQSQSNLVCRLLL